MLVHSQIQKKYIYISKPNRIKNNNRIRVAHLNVIFQNVTNL